ncbi:DUF551 domain-containing protein [Escherichia coli]|nr:DUF551 domain-containing protein [Escherichia coli]ELC9303816.1 DUF551 domain-containing protein [Escherichia coli]MCX3485989.1 DUF551 domain-containing protein [Escherichia coli]MCX3583031.1 DUF551 domain-containing protein [Escherichia coli]MCX3643417.1 DUF551 domain-containing protein [Escherichia coli]
MTTITKERLLTIKQWRETYGPGSNVVLPAEEAEELARIALASLEAEPVAYIFKHPAGKLFWALTDESNKDQSDVIPVYAAAPASVVPDNASEPLAYAYKELTPEIMRNHLAVFERYGIAPNDSSTTIQALRIALDGIERSDAMLHGAEPVSQTYKSQHTQFEQVADLYEMQFDDGRTCAFHTDAQKAAQWLQACDGNRVQEYVKLERLRNALSGNYPVTPDGWISCSERMPPQDDWILIYSKHGEYMAGQVQGEYVELSDGTLSWLGNALYWMPLPEPPQEVN